MRNYEKSKYMSAFRSEKCETSPTELILFGKKTKLD